MQWIKLHKLKCNLQKSWKIWKSNVKIFINKYTSKEWKKVGLFWSSGPANQRWLQRNGWSMFLSRRINTIYDKKFITNVDILRYNAQSPCCDLFLWIPRESPNKGTHARLLNGSSTSSKLQWFHNNMFEKNVSRNNNKKNMKSYERMNLKTFSQTKKFKMKQETPNQENKIKKWNN